MANYRNISMDFWQDSKVVDDFTPEDRYMYLYCMTNPHTNLCGCYEVSIKQIANETGYNSDSVERLLKRLDSAHNVLRYSAQTKELLILNWCRYNWSASDKLNKPLLSEIRKVKNDRFREYLAARYNERATVTAQYNPAEDERPNITRHEEEAEPKPKTEYKEIIDYLNQRAGTAFRPSSRATQSHINARLAEGFKVEDFKVVIDKMSTEWIGTEMQKYLRPETLFGPKFEGYLNAKTKRSVKQQTQPEGKSLDDLNRLYQRIKNGGSRNEN